MRKTRRVRFLNMGREDPDRSGLVGRCITALLHYCITASAFPRESGRQIVHSTAVKVIFLRLSRGECKSAQHSRIPITSPAIHVQLLVVSSRVNLHFERGDASTYILLDGGCPLSFDHGFVVPTQGHHETLSGEYTLHLFSYCTLLRIYSRAFRLSLYTEDSLEYKVINNIFLCCPVLKDFVNRLDKHEQLYQITYKSKYLLTIFLILLNL